MEFDIDFQKYKQFSSEEKELWNFELKKSQQCTINEILEHARITNGRVNKLESWRSLVIGGLLIISAVIVPLAIELFKNHLI